jgi:hypothetical protein
MQTLNCFRTFFKSLILSFFLAIAGYLSIAPVQAQEVALSDSAFISLITVTPGSEIYSHYGHTAIRVCDPTKRFDLVFNYGLFDFNSPNFIYRFLRGETDYLCGAFPYSDFLLEYQMENRGVIEQVINLKANEKEVIWQALVKNIQPKNRTYRYNFFFNNCATKPRDLIVNGIKGRIDYRWGGRYPTLRQEVHHFTEKHAWSQFGIDFLLGAQADYSATLSDQQFAPELLCESFDKAIIQDDSAKIRALVLETRQPVSIDSTLVQKHFPWPTPIVVFWTIFLLMAGCTIYEYSKGRHFQFLTAILYGLLGIAGSIIAFLVLFSVHPTTHINYLLLWMNPFHLVYAFGMIFGTFRKKIGNWYPAINLLLQVFALIGVLFLSQQLHPAMYPLLLMVLMRSALGASRLLKKYR